jgi:hypothetical protein
LGIFQHSYKSFSTNFLDQHDIKVALHKYVWQIWQFLIIQHGFWLIWLWSHLRGKGGSTSCLIDVFNVGRNRKYICYGALLGGMMIFVSPLSSASHSQMLTLNNNLDFNMFHCQSISHFAMDKWIWIPTLFTWWCQTHLCQNLISNGCGH